MPPKEIQNYNMPPSEINSDMLPNDIRRSLKVKLELIGGVKISWERPDHERPLRMNGGIRVAKKPVKSANISPTLTVRQWLRAAHTAPPPLM